MDDYYSTLHETNDGLYMSTSRKLHLCHLWYVDEHYNFNADSCVKPFEKNEQLHNVGVKKLVLQCREGCNIKDLLYRECYRSPNNSRFLFMFCLHLVVEMCDNSYN